MKFTMKYIVPLLAIVFSLLSLVVAFLSYKNSQTALENQKTQFQLEQRPNLSVWPQKVAPQNSYIVFSNDPIHHRFSAGMIFRITNHGNLPAKNVRLDPSNVAQLEGKNGTKLAFQVGDKPSVFLAPQDGFDAHVTIIFDVNLQQFQDLVETYSDPRRVGTVHFRVIYESDSNPGQTYYSEQTFQISKDQANLVSSEMR